MILTKYEKLNGFIIKLYFDTDFVYQASTMLIKIQNISSIHIQSIEKSFVLSVDGLEIGFKTKETFEFNRAEEFLTNLLVNKD